jgi:hypothetical protein
VWCTAGWSEKIKVERLWRRLPPRTAGGLKRGDPLGHRCCDGACAAAAAAAAAPCLLAGAAKLQEGASGVSSGGLCALRWLDGSTGMSQGLGQLLFC